MRLGDDEEDYYQLGAMLAASQADSGERNPVEEGPVQDWPVQGQDGSPRQGDLQ
jgi:hypothetical protein